MITDEAVFELRGVAVKYPLVEALRNVSVRIRHGEQVALVGPSGAGKTTLLRVLNGTALATSGSVRAYGQETQSLSEKELRQLRCRIGFVYQNHSLVPNLRVSQNVLSGRFGRFGFLRSLRTMLLPGRSQLDDVHRLLDRVGIEEKLFERTDKLSGGQQQRVAIARALYQQPDSVLADEPISSVDPARARDTIRLLTEIAKADGITLCASLHNLELAREFFPRLIGLRKGEIVFDAKAETISDEQFESLYALPADVSTERQSSHVAPRS